VAGCTFYYVQTEVITLQVQMILKAESFSMNLVKVLNHTKKLPVKFIYFEEYGPIEIILF